MRTEERRLSPEAPALCCAVRDRATAVRSRGRAPTWRRRDRQRGRSSILGDAAAGTGLRCGFHAVRALALGDGFVGAAGLVTARLKLLQATQLSMANLSEVAAIIWAREQTGSAPV